LVKLSISSKWTVLFQSKLQTGFCQLDKTLKMVTPLMLHIMIM